MTGAGVNGAALELFFIMSIKVSVSDARGRKKLKSRSKSKGSKAAWKPAECVEYSTLCIKKNNKDEHNSLLNLIKAREIGWYKSCMLTG